MAYGVVVSLCGFLGLPPPIIMIFQRQISGVESHASGTANDCLVETRNPRRRGLSGHDKEEAESSGNDVWVHNDKHVRGCGVHASGGREGRAEEAGYVQYTISAHVLRS
jgi:hypothetical protein